MSRIQRTAYIEQHTANSMHRAAYNKQHTAKGTPMSNNLSANNLKAILLDYTGTMVQEEEPYTLQLLQYFLTHSDLNEPQLALKTVWGLIKKLEQECHGDTFIKKDEMVDRILDTCVKNYGLKGDLVLMHDLWRNSWIHAPLF